MEAGKRLAYSCSPRRVRARATRYRAPRSMVPQWLRTRSVDERNGTRYAYGMSLEDVLAAIACGPIDTRPDEELRAEIARNAVDRKSVV